jgi:hypothetical protein
MDALNTVDCVYGELSSMQPAVFSKTSSGAPPR